MSSRSTRRWIPSPGLDLAANYSHPLLSGSLTWDLVGNYTDQQTRTARGVTYDRAGALGASPDVYASGVPKFRATLSATYQEGPLSLTVQERFIGSARLSNGTQGQPGVISASLSPAGVLTRGDIYGLVDDNGIGGVAYLDLRASYRVRDNIQLYAAIDNLANEAPPAIPSTGGNNGTNQQIYDALGRAIRIGVGFSNPARPAASVRMSAGWDPENPSHGRARYSSPFADRNRDGLVQAGGVQCQKVGHGRESDIERHATGRTKGARLGSGRCRRSCPTDWVVR